MTKKEIGVLAVRIMALLMLLRGSQMLFFAAGSLLAGMLDAGAGPSFPYYLFQVVPYLILAPVFWFGAEPLTSLICAGGDLDVEAVSFASNKEVSTLAFALFGLYTFYFTLPLFLMSLSSAVNALLNPYSGRVWVADGVTFGGHLFLILLSMYLLFNSKSFVNWLEGRKNKANKL